MTPLLAGIVEQGSRRRADARPARPKTWPPSSCPLILGANEVATDLYFARQAGTVTFDEVERTLEAYPAACERILGLPAGRSPSPTGRSSASGSAEQQPEGADMTAIIEIEG